VQVFVVRLTVVSPIAHHAITINAINLFNHLTQFCMKILFPTILAAACAHQRLPATSAPFTSATKAQGVDNTGLFGGLGPTIHPFRHSSEDGHEVSTPSTSIIDSSISQIFVGYNFTDRVGVHSIFL